MSVIAALLVMAGIGAIKLARIGDVGHLVGHLVRHFGWEPRAVSPSKGLNLCRMMMFWRIGRGRISL